jgi:hypothetical protein
MRKRYRVLLLAAIVAAFIVPVGFALSLESSATTATYARYVAPAPVAHAAVVAPALMPARQSTARSSTDPVPDGAKLFAVGTVLVGLAAAVRKAV